MGLPMEVAQGQAWDEARRKELVDLVRVEILDCSRTARVSCGMRQRSECRGRCAHYLSPWRLRRSVPWRTASNNPVTW